MEEREEGRKKIITSQKERTERAGLRACGFCLAVGLASILNEQKETACDDDDDAATPIFFPFLPFLSLRFPSLPLSLSVLSFLSFLPEINELQMSGWMLPCFCSSLLLLKATC